MKSLNNTEITNSKRKFKFKNKKFITIYILALLLCIALIFSLIFSYDKLLKEFKSNFEDSNYNAANKVLLQKQNFNPAKHILLSKDLTKYFGSYWSNLKDKYEKNEISELKLLSIISEMDKYISSSKELSEFKSSLSLIKDSNKNYDLALNKFKDKDYIGSFELFKDVIPFEENYLKSIDYKEQISFKIKENAIKSADSLASQNYYSKAITLLKENMCYYGNDKDILAKIDDFSDKKDQILGKSDTKTKDSSKKSDSNGDAKISKDDLAEDSKSSMTSSTTTKITKDNINSLGLSSGSKFLVYVDLRNQRTQVYKGSKDSWDMLKDFTCSTGAKGKETPSGTYNTVTKGQWFFSPQYNQGGKYWVAFKGNYMFHSLPFAKDKKTVLDNTLGTPSSHGCIRLSIEDSKWLYDNLPIGSKLIIN